MRRPGFALIAVFWIIMVVGLFAAIVASRTGYNIERSGWAVDIGRVRAATDGAGSHGDDKFRIGHHVVQTAYATRHFVRDRTGDDH